MSAPTRSYEKVPYDLRPAKQVERRMIMDALVRLMNGGFTIRDYQYTGFGSIYFFDFLLLYKLIGLRRLLSVEHDVTITKRVQFNKPFDLIAVRMDSAGAVIPDLSADHRHILWLDYDDQLSEDMLSDVAQACHLLSAGSIVLVTVDAEPPRGTDSPEDRARYFADVTGDLLPFDFDLSWCRRSRLPETNLRILFAAAESGVAARAELRFCPLFKFSYADGHRMVTAGGMIATSDQEACLDKCNWDRATYLRRSSTDEPYEIEVPRLTRKERLYLDHHMPCPDSWVPAEFELEGTAVKQYREIHRFYPHYEELLV